TGLRPGEAFRLDRSDVDLVSGILSIRESKFGNYAAFEAMPIRWHWAIEYARNEPAGRCSRDILIGIVSTKGL
ncbi:hypothetical protein, partial [Paraburkholderia mimosarum]|uniref:hypothetical protein n=1 Tax=Paraburkholderia mimosarum TaxID=312026 RepID=UPI0005630B5E